MPGGNGKPRRGGGQFRGAVSTYDKRATIEKQRALKAKKVNKYRKALARMEADGRLVGPAAAAPADLDALFLGGDVGFDAQQREQGSRQQQQRRQTSQQDHQPGRQRQDVKLPLSSTKRPRREEHSSGDGRAAQGLPLPPPPSDERVQDDHNELSGGGAKRRQHKGAPSQLERLAVKRQAELELERTEKEEFMKEAQRRREELQAKTKQRKESKAKFFAKTRRGQPVMKHRLDKILGALQADKL